MEALVCAVSELRIREGPFQLAPSASSSRPSGFPLRKKTQFPPLRVRGVQGGLAASQVTVSDSSLSSLSTASSSSMDPAKGVPSQPGPPEGLGLRPKRSRGAFEESPCPLCKRTRSRVLERP
nr:uncharacterized protein C16orf90 homolog [Loxodonta africana]